MAKKLLMRVDQEWQLHAVAQELAKLNIHFEVRPKAREYASIITGVGGSAFDLFVEEEDYTQANAGVQRFFMAAGSEGENLSLKPNHFRRVVLFSVMGVLFLPLFFNWRANVSFMELQREKPSSGRLAFALLILIIGWILSVWEIVFIVREFKTLFPMFYR